MKILVLGGGGQVARALSVTAPAGHDLQICTHGELDITDRGAVERRLASHPVDCIINAAAYTAVDRAEDEPELARAVNEMAVGYLAEAAAAGGCSFVHLSTDFVFDGRSGRAYRPTDATNPLSVYGRTKLAGEEAVLRAGGRALVVRTAWVYAAQGRNFVLTMVRLMGQGERVRVVADQIGTPTHANGLATAIWGLIDTGAAAGIYHWTDLGVASWFDFAVAIQEEALARELLTNAVPIVPISTAEYPTRARRPPFSVLDSTATRAIIPAAAQHWRQALRTMLDELRAA